MKRTIILAAASIAMTTLGAHAEATCESVATDLTGKNVYGDHTMGQLVHQTEAGDCNAAAFLSRRARAVEGFLETNCSGDSDLQSRAADMLRLAEDVLKTPECRD